MTPEQGQDQRTARVLVVDDDATQRLLTRNCLENEGFSVFEAEDGEAGLAAMRHERPDAVLLDVLMPGRDGFAICAEIRADPALSETPVILVTGQDDTEAVERAFSVEANDFIAKPVLWVMLPHRLRFVLRRQRMQHELREALAEAETANKARSEFLANMGHELRTPLNAIIGFSDMLRGTGRSPVSAESARGYAEDIHSSGVHLLKIVNDILDIASAESGRLSLSEAHFAIQDVTMRAVRRMRPLAEASQVTIVNGVAEEAPVINGDEARVTQIIANLLSNAVRFSPAGSAVRLWWEEDRNGDVAIAIADSGPGIPTAELSRLQRPFQQLDGSTSRKHDGTGLGVSIARALATSHGGTLVYDSRLGEGTTVRFMIPAERVVTTAPQATHAAAAT